MGKFGYFVMLSFSEQPNEFTKLYIYLLFGGGPRIDGLIFLGPLNSVLSHSI